MFYEAEDAPDLDPAEAMSLVAHDVRVDILLELWQAEDHELAFSELRKRVGVRDTSKFNYHLSKLDGRFLAHVGDQYELIYPGHRVVDAIQSGAFTRRDSVDPFPVEGSCPDCDGGLEFEYEGYVVRIHCRDCGERVLRNPLDPAAFVGREAEGVVQAFDQTVRRLWLPAADGVCPTCAASTTARLVDPAGLPEHCQFLLLTDQPRVVATECDHCSFYAYFPAGVVLLEDPTVVGWHHDHGVDLRDPPFWALPFVADGDLVELVADDPPSVAVTAAAGGETVRAVVDESTSVTDVSLAE